ncbi:MAG: metal-sensing transcriptional repressor [Telluria sp.]
MDEGPLNAEQKKDLMHRLARIEGQLRGVQKLVAIAQDASDVDAAAQQMAAASKALDRCFVHLMSSALRTQGANARDLASAQEACAHLAQILDKYL